jgi:transcriptional regulator with XRE-family HTH domain
MNYLHSNLRALRKGKYLTQQGMAFATDIPKRCIESYEAKRASPSIKRLIYLADYFKVSLDDLILKDLS